MANKMWERMGGGGRDKNEGTEQWTNKWKAGRTDEWRVGGE
jgi:hypothetical protein